MYWRVRKITPDMLVRQYGVHIGLIVSVLLNLLLIGTGPTLPKVAPELKQTIDIFARQVTQHLLDTSYISYVDSTAALLNGELSPRVVDVLRQQGLIAKNDEDLRAQAKELTDQRQVAAVKIESVNPMDPDNTGLTPVDVKGKVAVHSSQDAGPATPVSFYFRYWIGARVGQDQKPEMVNGLPVPMVAQFKDLSSSGQ